MANITFEREDKAPQPVLRTIIYTDINDAM
jgi:hypothetical protein